MARGFRLDIDIYLGRSLVSGNDLDLFQSLLRDRAPGWSAGLLARWGHPKKVPVDVNEPGALARALREPAFAAAERARKFDEANPGGLRPVLPGRVFGSEELRGTDYSLIVIPIIDDLVLMPIAGEWHWGNSITIQLCRARVEGIPAVRWAHDAFVELCRTLTPVHAHAQMSAEYDAKNMFNEQGRVAAMGVDPSKALKGLYWLNYLGRPYRDLIGREQLLSAPAFAVQEIGDGIMLSLGDDARAWETPECREREQAVLDHLGRHFFFDRAHPDRPTVAPPFDLRVPDSLPDR